MTIASTTDRNDYVATGINSTYNYTFKIFQDSDIKVTIKDLFSVETTLQLGVDYSVDGVGLEGGGTITLLDLDQDWINVSGALVLDYVIAIRRDLELTQPTDIRNQGAFFPEIHEDTFDRLTMISQQIQGQVDRAIKLGETVSASDFDVSLPIDILDSSDRVLAVNPTGTGFIFGTTLGSIAGAAGEASAAAASAADALASQIAAELAETNAETAETNAELAQANAEIAEANAETAQDAAEVSRLAAEAAQAAAEVAQANAELAEAGAELAETNAELAQTGAETAETNAAASAAAAAASEVAADTSADAALVSETNAAASAASINPSTFVTITGAQTVTGIKTLSTPVIDDYAVFNEEASPSTPASGQILLYAKNDKKFYKKASDGLEIEIGSGAGGSSGINYIVGGDAQSGIASFATYADAAGALPVDGTGGSAITTFTVSTSSPLRGTSSFLLTKDAANRQGEGASVPFTIDSADKNKVLTISADYAIASGTFVTGDVGVYIYDITNATVIQPAGFTIQAATANLPQKLIATFQTASNSTSYRLIFHVASVSALAYTVKMDNISVGPQIVQYGAPVTDSISFTPTGSWTTNATYTGKYWRVGDRMHIAVGLALAGATDAAVLTINLPSGHSIDTSKIITTTAGKNSFGTAMLSDAGSGYYVGEVVYNSTTSVRLGTHLGSEAGSSNTSPFTFGNTDRIDLTFDVPILGWSSSVSMSNDTDTRVVAVVANDLNGISVPTGGGYTSVPFSTIINSTHGMLSSGTITIPVPGYYDFECRVRWDAAPSTSNQARRLRLFKNGSTSVGDDRISLFTGQTFTYQKLTGTAYFNAGDTAVFQLNHDEAGSVTTGSGNSTVMSFSRISGPSQIAASESVNAKYRSSSGQSIPASGVVTIVDYGSPDHDSHGSVVTGSSWKFVANSPGLFEVGAYVTYNAASFTSDYNIALYLYKNGSLVDYLDFIRIHSTTSKFYALNGSSDIRLIAGDYIDIRTSHDEATARTLVSVGAWNYVNIKRTGN